MVEFWHLPEDVERDALVVAIVDATIIESLRYERFIHLSEPRLQAGCRDVRVWDIDRHLPFVDGNLQRVHLVQLHQELAHTKRTSAPPRGT